MGVTYKLKPEINDFIIETKKNGPALGCRTLVTLVHEKFQIKVSKSSINNVMKNAGLSMPVGRRLKPRRKKSAESAGALTFAPIKSIIKIAAESVIELSHPKEPIAIEPAQTPEEQVIIAPVLEKTEETPHQPKEEEKVSPTLEQALQEIKKEEAKKQPEVSEEVQVTLPQEEREATVSYAEAISLSEVEGSGAVILKAIDYLVGGTTSFVELIKHRLDKSAVVDLLPKTESLLYAPLFDIAIDNPQVQIKPDSALWSLLGCRLRQEDLNPYLNTLQQVKILNTEIFNSISNFFPLVRGIQVRLFDGSVFYLDSQFHTIWSTPQIPHDFSETLFSTKRKVLEFLHNDKPFILFMAPGYDMPTKELFDFILSLDTGNNKISRFSLFDNKFQDLENIPAEEPKKLLFLFGLWPWQFGQYRKVSILSDFNKFPFEPLKKYLFAAEAKIDLKQPQTGRSATLRACALKFGLEEKIKLVIISNYSVEQMGTQELINAYFNSWPKPEETFENYSRTVELFTYTANSQKFFNLDDLHSTKEVALDTKTLFNYYLKILDLYARWHIFPSGYEEKDFSVTKSYFYDLKVVFSQERDYLKASFQVPQGYPFYKELLFACSKLNENQVWFFGGKRVWFIA